MPVDLPHTRIAGTIRLHFVEMNVKLENKGHRVIPDYPVVSSIHDVLERRDIQMQLGVSLMSKQN